MFEGKKLAIANFCKRSTELVSKARGCATDGGKCRGEALPETFAPGDWVKLNDDAKSGLQQPWQVVEFDAQTDTLTLTHPQFGNSQLQRPRQDVIALVYSPRIQKPNLHKLHQLLIEPIQQFLPENPDEQVIFIPHQELFSVPFAALQDEEDNYLIEQHTIRTAPSIQALQLTKQRQNKLGKPDISQSQLVVVGNPDMPNNPEKPGEDVKLSSLPFAENEANQIADLFNTTALIGSQATETTVVEKMQTADIIHFATHGLLGKYTGGSIPGAIALSEDNQNDGILTADELFNLENQLSAQLVVLSACGTGRGEITGDGVIGLSRSLMSAGVPSILVTLWSIPDDSTAFLMNEFYQQLLTNPDRAQALRQAMLITMKAYPGDLNWAAFTLIGES